MNDDRIQPERDFCRGDQAARLMVSERAWVKRDFDFWHRCTVEEWVDDGVIVSLDNMDELTVRPDEVQQFSLEADDLVFAQHWIGSLSGSPGFVRRVQGEIAEVDFSDAFYSRPEVNSLFMRDLLVYRDLPAADWQPGARVFAYKAVRFVPPLCLFFPAIVDRVLFDAVVSVEFTDGEMTHVPITLIEPLKLGTGDIVHTCTNYQVQDINPERWGQCRVVKRDGDRLLLEDGNSAPFEATVDMIAKLPKSYRMRDGKLERLGVDAAGILAAPNVRRSVSPVVHIVRTESWVDAAADPITKACVDQLLIGDTELAWLSGGGDDASGAQAILWQGVPCFWWNRSTILCTGPNQRQLAKMIEIAIELDANVIGEDGQEHH